ncbi:MAG: hypothetical protein AB7D36_08585 [Oscillospiraceae bacterium]
MEKSSNINGFQANGKQYLHEIAFWSDENRAQRKIECQNRLMADVGEINGEEKTGRCQGHARITTEWEQFKRYFHHCSYIPAKREVDALGNYAHSFCF